MKYLVQTDDGVFFHQAVVEAPPRTDKLTLLEMAMIQYKISAGWVRKDYFEDGSFERDLRRDGWDEDEIHIILDGYEYSPVIGKYLDMDNCWTRPVPPNTLLGYFVGGLELAKYRQKSEWLRCRNFKEEVTHTKSRRPSFFEWAS